MSSYEQGTQNDVCTREQMDTDKLALRFDSGEKIDTFGWNGTMIYNVAIRALNGLQIKGTLSLDTSNEAHSWFVRHAFSALIQVSII